MKTPVRTLRIPDPLWARVAAEAARLEVTPSEVVRDVLDRELP